MRVIIAGSRWIKDFDVLERAMSNAAVLDHIIPTVIVSGMARGVDMLGVEWADKHGLRVQTFYANWLLDGRSAGFIRNEMMARHSDALVALWDGESRGTAHMIKTALRFKLSVFIEKVKPYDTDEL
jgi:hypothetical protein